MSAASARVRRTIAGTDKRCCEQQDKPPPAGRSARRHREQCKEDQPGKGERFVGVGHLQSARSTRRVFWRRSYHRSSHAWCATSVLSGTRGLVEPHADLEGSPCLSRITSSQEVVAPEQDIVSAQRRHRRMRAEHPYGDRFCGRRRGRDRDLGRQEARRQPGTDRRTPLHWFARDQRLQQRSDAGARRVAVAAFLERPGLSDDSEDHIRCGRRCLLRRCRNATGAHSPARDPPAVVLS